MRGIVLDVLVSRTLNILTASVSTELSPEGCLFKKFEAAKYFLSLKFICQLL